MAEGLIIADADGNLIEWNPAALRLHGFDTVEEVQAHLSEFTKVFALFWPDGTPVPLSDWPMSRLLRGEAVTDWELHLRRLDTGQEWDISYSGAQVVGPDGRADMVLLSTRDVTDRKRLEAELRQAQKMEAVGQLAAGVAHDFNNLLTVINGYGEILQDTLPAGSQERDLAAEMVRAGERAAGLTRQLLAFSRQTVIAPRVLDVNTVVADVEKMLRRVIGEDVRLATSLQPGLGSVRADPGQLEQVLLNLAVNARDAMPTGGRLTISTREVFLDEDYARAHRDAHPGQYVQLSVADSGHGMDDATRARLFEPFFTTKGPGKGTGLGLATVYGIVTQAGGLVTVDSAPGAGATFRVHLPVAEDTARPEESQAGISTTPGTECVLVVEDEPAVRALARQVLESYGYTTLVAGDGQEAVRVCADHYGPIHLLVTDVVMPGAGGRVLAERLRTLRPGMRVLFMSGYTDDAVVRHGVQHAEVHFLQKPFRAAALARKVREVLDADAMPTDVAGRRSGYRPAFD
jgi:PAS domain S-box-containing protein